MQNSLLVHKHLIIRAEAVKPPMDEEILFNWLRDFIDSINMKVLMGPYIKYHDVPGNRGITGAAIIETSHIVMHVWDECNPALMQFDVYSCGEFDPHQICDKISKDFGTDPPAFDDDDEFDLDNSDDLNRFINKYEQMLSSKPAGPALSKPK